MSVSEMTDTEQAAFRRIAQGVGPIIAKLESPDRHALVAVIERTISERYLVLAVDANTEDARLLNDCAARELENAEALERLDSTCRDRQKKLLESHPVLCGLVGTSLADLSRAEQMKVLSEAELMGAELYQQVSLEESSAERRVELDACVAREKDISMTLASLAERNRH